MRKIDLEAERRYENEKATGNSPRRALSKFYWATRLPLNQHFENTYRSISGKDVLEIGCTTGGKAIEYAKHARSYVGVDIADLAIEKARARNISNAEFICVDGHQIPRPDQSFDCVIVNSMLHHLELERGLREIWRLLKDDGILIFFEPLGINPAFWLYRQMTPHARTADERPFSYADLKLFATYFDLDDVTWFGLTTPICAFYQNENLREKLTKVDQKLSRTPLKYLYWQIMGFGKKINSL